MNALFFISALKLAERQFSTYNIFRFQLIHVEIELEWHRTTCVNYVWYVCKWVSGVCVCVFDYMQLKSIESFQKLKWMNQQAYS